VRLLNDRALMLVHHLKRDWEIAEQCLQEGIALGEQQLENPPEDAGDRQVLDEAIGDCYENLGLYHLEHTEDLDKAEANYKKALTYYPTESRFGTRRGLRRVEERRKDGVERDRL
jgi:tetratricopeptide (TPR) repeat protein